jgi:hypothetical protein
MRGWLDSSIVIIGKMQALLWSITAGGFTGVSYLLMIHFASTFS